MNWSQLGTVAPELASTIQQRFEAHLHHVVATLRRDGSPRVSGTEARFFDGELYLGCMPGSRKGDDLRRDPRVALHAATIDVEMKDGDAKIAGRAVLVNREEASRFLRSLSDHETGADDIDTDPPVDGDVFAIDVTEATLTKVDGDELVIETWSPTDGVRTIRRK
ncbi:MAG TPA: pyridoxamine 5'-phosphate oxidase family protein [Microthrixaceae bacterium]|nr:pyridoxamine 5'-phosphate oxidase family protein [Microthrixaceae bacterium]HND56670.1 pyridoxamine 5'-phosphate oxidase family protein [Pirellulaceae bacterium]HNI34767.1 pyridoxamine 5'-phosphate oxidase family protein [Microthrixaceae bacterium]